MSLGDVGHGGGPSGPVKTREAQAIASLIDVVEELCLGLAAGQTPSREWAQLVSATLAEHRATLGFTSPGDG